MRVLVVEDDPTVAKLFASVLAKVGHDVCVVFDGPSALERVSIEDFDAVVCDWMLPTLDGTTVVREVRKRPGRQPAFVLTSGALGAVVRAHASRAGADEFLPKPLTAASIVAAVNSAVDKRAKAKAPAHPIVATAAWTGLASLLAAKLQECTGLAFAPEPAGETPVRHRASLSMLDVARDTDLCVALFAEHDTGLALTKAILGTEAASDAEVAEVLAELCNNACGMLKTATRGDGFAFTLGLPTFDAPAPRELESTLLVSQRCALRAGDLRLDAVIGVHSSMIRSIATAHLDESMVLAEDVHNETGLLVAAKGLRLTSVTAERIARHAPRRFVRVCSFG